MKKFFNLAFVKILFSVIFLVIAYFLDDGFLSVFLYFVSYILVAWELLKNTYHNILEHVFFDENTLMLIATASAFFIKEYPEAVMVVLLYNLGEALSHLAVHHSKESVTKLMDLTSDEVRLLMNDEEILIPAKDAKVGDIFIVKPGELVPLDGVIVKGEANLDTSSLTGESLPRTVSKSDVVLSGTISLDSVIYIKATKTLENSTASKILALIENSDDKKANTEKIITRFAKVYTPIVVTLAFVILIVSLMLSVSLHDAIYTTCVFLVMSCPCALVLSVPLSYFCGIGRASKEGILIKGAVELENLKNIDTIAFDKTGTITEGTLEVSKIIALQDNEDYILKIASFGEHHSNHPIAKSIVKRYGKEIDTKQIQNFVESSGKGISFTLENKDYFVGNEKLLIDNKIDFEKVNEAGTTIYVANNKNCLGYLIISDKIKKDAKNAICHLKDLGIKHFTMISGDSKNIVEHVASEVGIDEFYAESLPEEKVRLVTRLKKTHFLAFVGDGMNDAPVMKVANLGISMGGIGSDATIEASDIVLMHDDLKSLVTAIQISKITNRLILFNISFAVIIKMIVLILSLFQMTNIWMAVFADVGVSLLCVLNTLTILKRKFLF